MHLIRFFVCIASCLSVARAFSVTVGTPTQCGPLSISWTGGQAPFEILLAPDKGIYQNIPVPASAFSNGQGSYSIPQLSLLSGTSFLLIMSDATGFGSGGTTNILIVNSAANNICGAGNPSPPYTFDLSPTSLTQCSPFAITATGGVVPPITIGLLIPGGQSVVFNSDSNTFQSVLDVIAGTNVMYFVNDSLGNQGGVSPFEPVSGSSDSSCLSASSSSTAAGISATATASPSSSPNSSSSNPSSSSPGSNVALIAGAAGGGAAAVLIALVILGMCLRRKRKASKFSDAQSSTQSHPHRLQRTDLKYEGSPRSDALPQFPLPYKTNSVSNHTQPVRPSPGAQSDMANLSASNFAVSVPPSPFNHIQHSRQSSNTDTPIYGDARTTAMPFANDRQSPLSTRNLAVSDPRTPFNQTLHSHQSSNADFAMYTDTRGSAIASVDRRMAVITELPSPWEINPVSYLARDHQAPFNQAQPSYMSSNTDFAVDGDARMTNTMPVEQVAVGARPASPLPRKTDLIYLTPPVQPGPQSIFTSASNIAIKNPPTPFNQTQHSHKSPGTDNVDVHGASGGQPMVSASGQTAHQPPTQIIVHTDADDAMSNNNGVVELPPQYSEHRGTRAL